jgi:hypothetical protein
MPVLIGSTYDVTRGGHAPGDVREAFCEACDALEHWDEVTPEPTVEVREQQLPITKVFGLLSKCTDTLPGMVYDQVCQSICVYDDECPQSRTYAAASRALLRLMKKPVPRTNRNRLRHLWPAV